MKNLQFTRKSYMVYTGSGHPHPDIDPQLAGMVLFYQIAAEMFHPVAPLGKSF